MNFSEEVTVVRSTRHVHPQWYLEAYPEVAELGLDPAAHYLLYGAALGRDPGPDFDTTFYRATYPEVAETGLNPLVHYALFGKDLRYETRPAAMSKEAAEFNALRNKLLTLGFAERPLAELTALAEMGIAPQVRALAARETALWAMRLKTPQGYRTALTQLALARNVAPDRAFRGTLVSAEMLCHFFLGDMAAGEAVYERAALGGDVTPDVMLARSNFGTTAKGRLVWINQVLEHYAIPQVALGPEDGHRPAYDHLTSRDALPPILDGPKVTVIIAAYQAAETLPTALRSLQEQTWKALEILVVDDASPGSETREAAQAFARDDPRIQVLQLPENGGAYVARNHALDRATGDYIAIHDADDWSHPRKLETQVRFLENHPAVIGCMTQQARCRPDLAFVRGTGGGPFIIANVSSFLWRREPVRAHLGYWDPVRFGADNEIIRRIQRTFGAQAVVELPSGPLSFQRVSETSALADSTLGMDGFYFGARKEYYDAQQAYHASGASLKYASDPKARLFPAPALMLSDRAEALKERRFDVAFCGDFRIADALTLAVRSEIMSAVDAGNTVALIEAYEYDLPGADAIIQMHASIRQLVDGKSVSVVVFGEECVAKDIRWRSRADRAIETRYLPTIRKGV